MVVRPFSFENFRPLTWKVMRDRQGGCGAYRDVSELEQIGMEAQMGRISALEEQSNAKRELPAGSKVGSSSHDYLADKRVALILLDVGIVTRD